MSGAAHKPLPESLTLSYSPATNKVIQLLLNDTVLRSSHTTSAEVMQTLFDLRNLCFCNTTNINTNISSKTNINTAIYHSRSCRKLFRPQTVLRSPARSDCSRSTCSRQDDSPGILSASHPSARGGGPSRILAPSTCIDHYHRFVTRR